MKRFLKFIRDLFEFYLPILAFVSMFVTFILQVFFRYVMRHPLTWTQEVILLTFIWSVIFGACYTMRCRSHIKFTLIYDSFPAKPAAACRLLGNLIVAGIFAVLIVPSWKYSMYLSFEKTAVFRIPFTFMFLSFVYFLCSIICYTIVEIIEDIKVLSGRISDSVDHKIGKERL
jgi:TRAP-type C4-dicarboxylate transport system permease small subunit